MARKALLRLDQVVEIRRLYGPPAGRSGRRKRGQVTLRALAEQYAVSIYTIRDAVNGDGAYARVGKDLLTLLQPNRSSVN